MASINYSLKHKGIRLISAKDAWVFGKNKKIKLNPEYIIVGKIEASLPNMIISATDKRIFSGISVISRFRMLRSLMSTSSSKKLTARIFERSLWKSTSFKPAFFPVNAQCRCFPM